MAYRRLLKSLGVDSRSRWTPLEEKVAAHPAGAALASSKEREALFRAYVAELRVSNACVRLCACALAFLKRGAGVQQGARGAVPDLRRRAEGESHVCASGLSDTCAASALVVQRRAGWSTTSAGAGTHHAR